jgi:hypothetical protein
LLFDLAGSLKPLHAILFATIRIGSDWKSNRG